jgi:group 2 family glycosyl transferase
MCTYNGEKYIKEQIESIYEQSRKPDEVIIIDDCSIDNTILIIENFINTKLLNTSWRIIKNESNKGWRLNFRDGIEMVSGDLVFFSDQDDIWERNKLLDMACIFETNKEINVLSSVETLFRNREKYSVSVTHGELNHILLGSNGENFQIRCPGCAMGLRSTYYKELEKYYTQLWAHDDFFWKFSALDGSGYLWNHATIFRRIHGGNASIVKHRNIYERVQMLERDNLKFEKLIEYCSDLLKQVNDRVELARLNGVKRYVEQYIQGNKIRIQYLKTKKISLWTKLLREYRFIYYSPKVMIGDLVIHNKSKLGVKHD